MADTWQTYKPENTGPVTPTAAMGKTAEQIKADAARAAAQTTDAFGDTAAYLAEDSFDSALQRLENAGTVKGVAGYMREPGSLLEQGYNAAVGYLADTGLAGIELSDAALKYAIGIGTEFVPGQDAQEEQRLARDLAGMVDYAAMTAPANVASAAENAITSTAKRVPDFVKSESGAAPVPRFLQLSDNAVADIDAPITFRSPTLETIDNIVYPKEGIKGSMFVKELKDTKGVRPSEVAAMQLQIDPMKRYTADELKALVEPNAYDVRMRDLGLDAQYQPYQRQFNTRGKGAAQESGGLAPREYKEYTFDATRQQGLPSFKPTSTHYKDETLFHTRGTVAEDVNNGDTVFAVEELQSDLLQHGYRTGRDEDQYNAAVNDFLMYEAGDFAGVFDNQDVKSVVDSLVPAYIQRVEDLDAKLNNILSEGNYSEEAMARVNALQEEDFLQRRELGIPNTSAELFRALRANRVPDDLAHDLSIRPERYMYLSNQYDEIQNQFAPAIAPPIKDIKETVRMTVDGLIGQAQKNGWDAIHFPTLEQIAARRFAPGTAEFYKAITPGSGFHNTYVKALDEALADAVDASDGSLVVAPKTRVFTPDGTSTQLDYPELYEEQLIEIKNDMGMLKKALKGIADGLTDEEILDKYKIDTSELNTIVGSEYNISLSALEHDISNGDTVDYVFKLAEEQAYKEAASNASYLADLDATGRELRLTDKSSSYDFTKPRFAEGGVVTKTETQMNRMMAEGGLNTSTATVDPVSGNEVPPGSMPEEVRDDIDARLSEGEYVVPADVVKYFGVAFFEGLRTKAKEGLASMSRDGRIGGGSPAPMDNTEEALPFDISELQVSDDGGEPAFADGGVVTTGTPAYKATPENSAVGFSLFNQAPQAAAPQTPVAVSTKTYVNATGQTIQIQFDANGNPITPIPAGYVPQETVTKKRDSRNTPVGMGGTTQAAQSGTTGSMGRLKAEDFASPEAALESFRTDLSQMGKSSTGGAIVGGLVGGPIGGVIGGMAGKGYQLSEARAKIQVARAYGYNDVADQMETELKGVTDNLGFGSKAILDSIAPGTTLARNFLRNNPAPTAPVAAQPTVTPSRKTGASAAGKNLKVPASTGGTGARKDTSAISQTKAKGSASLGLGSKPTAKPKPSYGGGRAKGGLVTKK